MALDRYQFTKSDRNKYKTTRYPMFKKQLSDLYIISRQGDRLDNISHDFYKDPRYWWIIAQANNLGKGTMIIEPGLQIRIPFPILDLMDNLRDVEENK